MSLSPRVLVIEDNPHSRISLQYVLENHGFTVEVAADGSEGIAKALSCHPSIALVDLLLPDLSGYEVAHRLRGRFGDEIRLAACSAFSHPEARQRATDAGFDTFLVKPIDPECLLEWLVQTQA